MPGKIHGPVGKTCLSHCVKGQGVWEGKSWQHGGAGGHSSGRVSLLAHSSQDQEADREDKN